MKCGQGCPFCYGSMEGEGCVLLPQEFHHYYEIDYHNGIRKFYPRSVFLGEVNGEAITNDNEIVGDTCRFNFEKYVLWYYGLPV